MTALYKSEFRRFARWALGLGVLHAAALFLLDRSFPWLREDGEIAIVAGFTYAIVGAIFGFYQSASYGRVNQWIALLHRPLAAWRIMAAVKGAGATLLFAAVLVPLLLFTAALSLQVGRVVDARHWPLALAGALFALIGFGHGSYLALAPRRYGWTAIVAAAVLTVSSRGTGTAALLLPLLIVAVLALLIAGAFKPDRASPPASAGFLAPTAGVAAIALYFLLIGGTGLAWQLGLAAIGRNPEMNAPPSGGPVEAFRAESSDLIGAGLAGAPGPEAAAVREERRDSTAMRLPAAFTYLPTRNELTQFGVISFTDAGRNVRWTFSHDSDAFEGLRLLDRRRVGQLRPEGGFEAPPLPVGDQSMITGGSLYHFNQQSGSLDRLVRLPADERIVARPASIGPIVGVLSDRNLYLTDRSALEAGRTPGFMVAVPLGGPVGDLQRLDVARLSNRTIVSFFFGYDSVDGPFEAWQRVVSVGVDGAVHTLSERSLRPDYPDLLRFRSYWFSPALRAMTSAAEELGSEAAWFAPRSPVDVPEAIWIAAALLSFAASAATALLAVRRRLSATSISAWTLSALAFGLPLFTAFWLICRRPRLTI